MPIQRMIMAVRALFDRAGVESEMQKEMRLHIEMEMEENVRRGMPPAEARRRALLAFGGVERAKEATRDERSTRWLEDFAEDVRMGLRGMRKNPAFTAVVIALLALGTGANSAIFTVVNQLMLNPLPFADGDRMVRVRVTANNKQIALSPEQAFVDRLRARRGIVEDVFVSWHVSGVIGDTMRIPAPAELYGLSLQPGAMEFVGLRPALGREIGPLDTLPAAPRVIMLGHRLWTGQFNRDPAIVGKRILLNGQSHVVIGVAPRAFDPPFAEGTDYYTALQGGGPTRPVNAIVKLRHGVTFEQANRELAALGPTRANDFGVPLDPPTVVAGGGDLRDSNRRLVLLLFGAVGLVLLIACANVANLLLSRAWGRQREFAVRRALGAGRSRIMRQIFTESLLFALAGGVAGVGVALIFVNLLFAAQPSDAPLGTVLRIDRPVFYWTLGISMFTGLLFGIAPALFASGSRIGNILKSATTAASAGLSGRRLRSSLVVVEVAVSVILLAGTGLVMRTLVAMQRADLGVNTRGLHSLDIRLAGPTFKDSTVRRDALANIIDRVRRVPGVTGAAYVLVAPPDFGRALTDIEIEGASLGPADSLTATRFNFASPDMFGVAGIRLVEGRPFIADGELSVDAKGTEMVVNQRFARRFWPKESAIGKRVKYTGRWLTIVGVVDDVDVPGDRETHMDLQFYRSMPGAANRAALLVRSSIPAALLEPQLKRAVREANGFVRFRSYADVDAQLHAGRATHRFILALLGGFAALAILLAGIGLHAVIAHSVAQRRREIGIRVALGAEAPRIAGLVVRQGLLLAIAGIAIGVIASAAATRSLSGFLYGIEPGDAATSGMVALVLLAVAMLACTLPARRAVRIDPVEMLRAE